MKETTFLIVARMDKDNERSCLCPISSPITIYNEERFNEISSAIRYLGYGIVVIPKMIQQ